MKVDFSNNPSPVIDVESSVVTGPVGPVGSPGDVGSPGVACVDTAPAETIPTTPANTAVIVRPPADVATQESAAPGYNDEDIGFEDIMLKRLNLVYGVGDLSQIYEPGEWVLDGSLVLHVPANPLKKVAGFPPLNLTVLGFKKRQYVEQTKGGARGNLFNTTAEVVAAGGTLDYKESESTSKKLYHTLATALILVQKPAHIPDEEHLVFAHGCEGKFYSLALWGMKSTVFTHAAKKIFTEKKLGILKRGGYPSYSWDLTTKFESKYEQPTPIPVLTVGTKNTPAFAEFVKEVLDSGN